MREFQRRSWADLINASEGFGKMHAIKIVRRHIAQFLSIFSVVNIFKTCLESLYMK